MPIKIRCSCGNMLLAPEERLGQTGRCPNCDREIKVELPGVVGQAMSETTSASGMAAGPAVVTKPKKRSWLTRLLGVCIYLLFLTLVAGLGCLHYCSEKEIAAWKIENPAWAKAFWESNQSVVLMIRQDQQTWFHNLWQGSQKFYRSGSEKAIEKK